uniref:hypothetical protein n=1 Tax=Saccharothrix espanaensis TaxID=103731 RepID=UPI003F497934
MWLMLAAGIFLGGAGISMVTKIVAAGQGTAGTLASNLTGASISTVMAIVGLIAGLEVIHALTGKGKRVSKIHPILALLAPALILAGGGFLATLVRYLYNGASGLFV